ncbi:MAG: SDR family NAD(P)-dependent oxidoreductase [Candidatus Dormibacteraceae bacterium]
MEASGRVAIVMGGGTGIGRAVSMRLAKSGARAVVVNYSRSSKDAEATTEELRSQGVEALPLQVDVSDDAAVKRMVAVTVDRFGALDLLVNSAGTTRFIQHSDLDALTDVVWDEILSVNLKGTFYCCRAAAPELRKARGAIVNVSSIAAHRAAGSSIASAVSKAGIVQLTRALARSLAPEVRVNSVSPGQVSTRWFRSRFGEEQAVALERSIAETTPLRKIASADDVAQAVVALLEKPDHRPGPGRGWRQEHPLLTCATATS